jgi:inner membrane protein
MSTETPGSLISRQAVLNSPIWRACLLGLLVLLLQIPILLIYNVTSERRTRQQEATREVTSKWGKEQSLAGPRIVIPYLEHRNEPTPEGESSTRTEVSYGHFLAERLAISGRTETHLRYRGIFEVPVYRLTLELRGTFAEPDFSEWGVRPEDILWDRAHLSVNISDARAIQNAAVLSWNGENLPFHPGSGESGGDLPGIHASLRERLKGTAFDFQFPLELNGSGAVFFSPFGKQTTVDLQSNWPHPSFQGNWLPAERAVTDRGFEATWNIPFLGRGFPQKWTRRTAPSSTPPSRFGLTLATPVDPYRMVERSVKYAILFLALTFTTLWLYEVLSGLRIHTLQYLLMGVGMGLFYLLVLSLSEHLGFGPAYILASASTVVLLVSYSLSVLGKPRGAALMAVILGLLYGYLYVLLRNQDYALLVGSVGLFLALAVTMYLTRNLDWRALKHRA